MLNIHCIMHAYFERPGYIETWVDATAQCNLTINHVGRGEALLPSESFDVLMLMGGPQSPHEVDKYPYLAHEMALIREYLANDKHVFGICLGAQLIGQSLGALTESSPHKEVGVFPITLTEAGRQDPKLVDFPSELEVGHWHNDMPGLPQGAEVLAYSEGCPRQIVRFTEKAYGFQCHLELNPTCVDALVSNCAHDLQPGRYIDNAQRLLQADYSLMNAQLGCFLDRFLKPVIKCKKN